MDCKIMIVGAGPAGISAWLHLQKNTPQLASRTLVIEKAFFPRDKVCAGGVGAWSPEVLKQLEIELHITSLFLSDIEFRFGKEIYQFHEPNLFQVVQRKEFDHALIKTALNRGLELHEGEMLRDVIREKNRMIVSTNKGTYSVRVLVGADGALSAVRRKIMHSLKPRLAPTIQIFAPADPQYDIEFHNKKIVLNLTPLKEGLQGYLWHVPCLRGGAPSIAHGIVDFRIYPDRPRADLKEIFSRELQSRNIQPDPKSWSSHPISWLSKGALVSKPNVLLVGDAAGIEPALGGGIHIALSYGEVAAKAIADSFENNDFSFNDYKKRVQSHLVGEWIDDCTQRALEMYGGTINPLDVARKLFPESALPPELISQMVSAVEKALRTS